MDWVQAKERLDHDGNKTNSKYLAPIRKSNYLDKQPTPDARHQADKEKKNYSITLYFVLAWFGILIIMGGKFGDRRNQDTVWKEMPYGIY